MLFKDKNLRNLFRGLSAGATPVTQPESDIARSRELDRLSMADALKLPTHASWMEISDKFNQAS